MYFWGSKKSARIFLGANYRQGNSSHNSSQSSRMIGKHDLNIILSCIFLGAQYKVHVFFWVQNIRLHRTPPPPLLPIKFIPEYLPGKKTSVTFHYRYYFAFDNVGKVEDGVGGGD